MEKKNIWQMEKPENQKYFILSNSFKVAELFVTKILIPCPQKQNKKLFTATKFSLSNKLLKYRNESNFLMWILVGSLLLLVIKKTHQNADCCEQHTISEVQSFRDP